MFDLPEGVVEGHGVDDVGVLVQGKKLLSGVGVPDLAGAIVRASDELVSGLVEGTVGQRKQMGSQHLEKGELLHLVLELFLNQLLDELFELRLAGRLDEGFFEKDLVDQAVNVSPMQEISFTGKTYSVVKLSRSMDLVSTSPFRWTYSRMIPGGWNLSKNLFSFICHCLSISRARKTSI